MYSNIYWTGTGLNVGHQDWINHKPCLWGTWSQQGNWSIINKGLQPGVLRSYYRGVSNGNTLERVNRIGCWGGELTRQAKGEGSPKKKPYAKSQNPVFKIEWWRIIWITCALKAPSNPKILCVGSLTLWFFFFFFTSCQIVPVCIYFSYFS